MSGSKKEIQMDRGKKTKVMVALSGGVDSAVAAFLLKDRGCEVAGVTMCLGTSVKDTGRNKCCGPREIEDARLVCEKIGIAHHVIDFSAELQRFVIDPFIREYRSGRTPNPCVECNRKVKFGVLMAMARSMGFECLASGHYAVVERTGGTCLLRVPQDRRKDQSYFLAGIQREALKQVIFPLSDFTKEEVRQIAQREGLPVFSKPDSQDICFIPAGGITEFLKQEIEENPGDIVDRSGRVIGRHKGIAYYTVGQRSGLGISRGRPQYVLSLDAGQNRIVVGDRHLLLTRGLRADSLNLFADTLPQRAYGKIRYAHAPAPCSVSLEKDVLYAVFDEPQEAVTPGQTLVIYENDRVLASGIIREGLRI